MKDIKNFIEEKDIHYASIIMQKGKVIKINPVETDSLFPGNLKKVSFSAFDAIESPQVEVRQEESVPLRMLDSLNMLSQQYSSKAFKQLKNINRQIDSLYKSKIVIDYFDREYHAFARLVVFHQVYEYKNEVIFCFTIYKSNTNSMSFARIVKWCHDEGNKYFEMYPISIILEISKLISIYLNWKW